MKANEGETLDCLATHENIYVTGSQRHCQTQEQSTEVECFHILLQKIHILHTNALEG